MDAATTEIDVETEGSQLVSTDKYLIQDNTETHSDNYVDVEEQPCMFFVVLM